MQIRLLLLAQLGLGQHFSGLLTGGGVHVEVLEEDLGATGGRSATFGVVLGLDVDGCGHRSVRVIEGRSLAVIRGRDARTGARNGRESLPRAASARKGESRSGAAKSGVRRGASCPGGRNQSE